MINKTSRSLIFLYSAIVISTAVLVYLLLPPASPLSPLSSYLTPTPNYQPPATSYQVFGFLPYWNTRKLTQDALSSITHLTYFTLHLNGNGELVKLDAPYQEEPGYTNYKRILKNNHNNLILTFMPYDQEALTSTLTYSSTRKKAINTIVSLVKESNAQGVNIDFEPLGDVTPTTRDRFTLFIKELDSSLPGLLTISTYPSAASRPRLWDLPSLAEFTDYFVIMTYDYHLPTSLKSGPNSPLRGAGELFEHDILSNLAEISSQIPPRKILLGIPFYGYEWKTDSSLKYAPTQERGSVASLERIQELIDQNTLELLWDRNSLTPYAIRRDDDNEIVSQIYYESVESIRLKLELVKSSNLGGIAIWALGYEGETPDLWETIRSLNL